MANLLQQILDLTSRFGATKLSAVLRKLTSAPSSSLMQLVLHSGMDLRTALLDALCRLRGNEGGAWIYLLFISGTGAFQLSHAIVVEH